MPPAQEGEQILQDPCQFTWKADDLCQATQETGCVWGVVSEALMLGKTASHHAESEAVSQAPWEEM